MTIAVQLMPAGVEEAHFKRVPEGWLFTVTNPWIVAPRRTYLVNDAQKPAIAARARLARYVRLMVLLPIALLMLVALTMDPTLLNSLSVKTAMAFGVFAVVLAGAFTAADYLTVRPLIRHLPRTSQKISLADMLRSQTAAMSTKSLMILTFFFVMVAAGCTFEWLTSARGHGLFKALVALDFVLFAVMFAGMLIAKLRARNAV
jgi:hypothetical protein